MIGVLIMLFQLLFVILFCSIAIHSTHGQMHLQEMHDKQIHQNEVVQNIYDQITQAKEGLSSEEIQLLFHKTFNNSVAQLSSVKNYDPTGMIGFCFGRAMTAHLLARRLGLQIESVKKLFIIGDLRSNPLKPEWRFHVTTIIRDQNGSWHTIDPIMYRHLTIREWVETMRTRWDNWQGENNNFQAKLYLTPPTTVIPNIGDEYGIINLEFNPEIHDFLKSAFWQKALELPENEKKFTIYQIDSNQVENFFIKTDGQKEKFNFEGIAVEDSFFSYNNYFVDLLPTLFYEDFKESNIESMNPLSSSPLSKTIKTDESSDFVPLGFNLKKMKEIIEQRGDDR